MTIEKALPASETVKEMVRSFKGFCLKEKSLKEALHKVAKENLSSSIDASAQAPIIWNTLIQPSETSSFVKLISSNEPISGSNNLFTEGLREQTKMLVSSSKSKIAVLAGVISSPPGYILIGLGVGIFTSLVVVPKIRKFLSRKYRGKKILAFETLNTGDFDAIYLRSQGASYALSDFIEFWKDDFFGEKIEPLLNLDPIIERYRVKFLENLKKRFFEKKRDAKNSHLKNNTHALKLMVVEDLLKEQTQKLLFTDDYVISLQESKSALIEIGSKKRENNPLPTETQISISENRVTSKKDLFTDSPPEVIAALEKRIQKSLNNIDSLDDRLKFSSEKSVEDISQEALALEVFKIPMRDAMNAILVEHLEESKRYLAEFENYSEWKALNENFNSIMDQLEERIKERGHLPEEKVKIDALKKEINRILTINGGSSEGFDGSSSVPDLIRFRNKRIDKEFLKQKSGSLDQNWRLDASKSIDLTGLQGFLKLDLDLHLDIPKILESLESPVLCEALLIDYFKRFENVTSSDSLEYSKKKLYEKDSEIVASFHSYINELGEEFEKQLKEFEEQELFSFTNHVVDPINKIILTWIEIRTKEKIQFYNRFAGFVREKLKMTNQQRFELFAKEIGHLRKLSDYISNYLSSKK